LTTICFGCIFRVKYSSKKGEIPVRPRTTFFALALCFVAAAPCGLQIPKILGKPAVAAGQQGPAAGVTPAVPIQAPQPDSIPPSDQNTHQGTSVLEIEVDERGNVSDAKVVKLAGYGLDEKALETVRTWKFRPAMANGHPIRVRVRVEVNFRLHQATHMDPSCPTPFAFAQMDWKDPRNLIWGEFSEEVTSWWARQKDSGNYSSLCAVSRPDARYAIVWRAHAVNHLQTTPNGTVQSMGFSAASKSSAEVYQVSKGQIQTAPIFTSKRTSAMRGFKEAVNFLVLQASTTH